MSGAFICADGLRDHADATPPPSPTMKARRLIAFMRPLLDLTLPHYWWLFRFRLGLTRNPVRPWTNSRPVHVLRRGMDSTSSWNTILCWTRAWRGNDEGCGGLHFLS